MEGRLQSHIDAIVQSFEGEEDERDVLRCLSETARLRFCTQDLRAQVQKDVHELFEKNGLTGELVGPGLELCKRLRVLRMDETRTVDGYTAIDVLVEIAPPPKPKSKLQRKKQQQQANDPILLHFAFRREAGKPSADEEKKAGGKRRRETQDKEGKKAIPDSDDDDDEEEEGEEEGSVPRTIVTFTIAASRGHQRPDGLLEVNILSLFDRPSASGVLPVGVEQPEMEGEEEAPPADRAMVGVDGEALEELAAWLAPDMSPTECLMFLLQCPYHEEEWDVIGVVMDIMMADDDDDDDEGGCAEDGCGCHHHHDEEEEEEEGDHEEVVEEKPTRARASAGKGSKRQKKK